VETCSPPAELGEGVDFHVTLQLNAKKLQLPTAKNHIPKIIMSPSISLLVSKKAFFLCFAFWV